MMTSSVVKKANIAGDDVCSLENLAYNYFFFFFLFHTFLSKIYTKNFLHKYVSNVLGFYH